MEELVIKAKEGDQESFTELILIISDDLYKIAKTRLSNDDDIDDVIQDTMLETYKNLKKLKDVSKFKKWIIKILINKCNKYYKKKYKDNIFVNTEYLNELQNTTSEYKNVESNMDFYSIINFLSYEERIVLILYYLEEYKVKDIKEITKMNENTINIHLCRARKKLKEKYDWRDING